MKKCKQHEMKEKFCVDHCKRYIKLTVEIEGLEAIKHPDKNLLFEINKMINKMTNKTFLYINFWAQKN